jgi:hypothetical protein
MVGRIMYCIIWTLDGDRESWRLIEFKSTRKRKFLIIFEDENT